MNKFDQFSDWVAEGWAKGVSFAGALVLVAVWLLVGLIGNLWMNDTFHLALNSPTTAITFLGVFVLQNNQYRFEKAQNQRWTQLYKRLEIEDPVDDDGQKE